MPYKFLKIEMKTKLLLVAVAFSVFGLTGCKSNETKGNTEESSIEAPAESFKLSDLVDEEAEMKEDELAYSTVVTAIDSPDVDIEIPTEDEEEEYEDDDE